MYFYPLIQDCGAKGKSSHEFSDLVRKVVLTELGSEDLLSSESEDR